MNRKLYTLIGIAITSLGIGFYSCYDWYLYRVCSDRTAYSESTGDHLSRWILMFV